MARAQMSPATLRHALEAPDASMRLQAALAAGSAPAVDYIEVLFERCAIEPDFFVRDMLTWALICNDASAVVDRLLTELTSNIPQARAQALHTLSKIGDTSTWPAITPALLHDDDDEVARTAWRTAAGLVPEEEAVGLAESLSTEFNRRGREQQLSLSRAYVALGEAAKTVLEQAKHNPDPGVRAHAIATERLIQDPETEFDAAIAEAQRVVALQGAPVIKD